MKWYVLVLNIKIDWLNEKIVLFIHRNKHAPWERKCRGSKGGCRANNSRSREDASNLPSLLSSLYNTPMTCWDNDSIDVKWLLGTQRSVIFTNGSNNWAIYVTFANTKFYLSISCLVKFYFMHANNDDRVDKLLFIRFLHVQPWYYLGVIRGHKK